MKSFVRIFILTCIFIGIPLSCTTVPKTALLTLISLPPQYAELETKKGAELEVWLKEKSKEKLSDVERMIISYRLGTCESLKQARETLGQIGIPQEVKILYHIRWLSKCDPGSPGDAESADVVEKAAREPGALKEAALKALLERAILRNDLRAEIETRMSLSQVVQSSGEQTLHTNRAHELLGRIEDQAFVESTREKLELLSPRFIRDPQPDQFLMVADNFRKVRQFDAAQKWYVEASRSQALGWPEKIKAFDGLRQTKRLLGNRDDALEFAQKVFELNQKYQAPDSAVKSGIMYARALWTQHRRNDAKTVLAQILRKYKKSKHYPEALLVTAQIDEEEKESRQALERLAEVVKMAKSDSTILSKALWIKGWIEFKTGEYASAIESFRDLAFADGLSNSRFRAKYWLARTYEKKDMKQEAQTEYEDIINNDPSGYYGLLAHRQINRPFKPVNRAQNAPSRPNEGLLNSADELTRIAIWYTVIGETQVGRSWLMTKAHRLTSRQYAHLLGVMGSYAAVFSIFNAGDTGFRLEILNSEPELIFPKLWPEAVKQASQKFQVPTELIYAIMRQESSFDPKARSTADAFGLMQILPQVAKETSDNYGLPYQEYQDLENENINIPIGTALLRRLLNQYSENFILSVAAYNANEKAIRGWLRERYQNDPTVFIEEIPYEETRNYVKLVMRNFIFYQRLDRQEQAATFPDWCLKPLQASNN